MAKLTRTLSRPNPLVAIALVLGLWLAIWPARVGRSENFVFYFPNSHRLIPIEVIDQNKYLPLLQVLNLVGKISGIQEKKNTLKVWFGDSQLEFHQESNKVGLDKSPIELSSPVRVSSGQWMVPIDFVTTLLPRLAKETVQYKLGQNRIFLGGVRPSVFTVRLDQTGTGARLTLQFDEKVTVRTEASNGKWIFLFEDRPVLPMEQVYHFQNPYISGLQFDDQDGQPKLILIPATSGLNFYPTFTEGGRVLVADVSKPPATVAQQPQPSQPGTPPTPTPQPPAPAIPGAVVKAPEGPPGPPLPAIVIDAAHGGQDTGARSRDGVLEKDLVAQLASKVQAAMLATKKYRIVLTRVGDVDRSYEQRETAANLARPILFITLHAGNSGTNTPHVTVYSYCPASSPSPEAGGSGVLRSLFAPWERIQELHMEKSRGLAVALEQHLLQVQGVNTGEPVEAPARGLRSIDAPAVALELGSLSPEADGAPLANQDLLQQISKAITDACDSFAQGGA